VYATLHNPAADELIRYPAHITIQDIQTHRQDLDHPLAQGAGSMFAVQRTALINFSD
jgi:hypothetical protein